MKKLFQILALLLALAMAVSACAETAPAENENPVLFTWDGVAYEKTKVDETLQQLYDAGYLASASDYDTAIQYMIEDLVVNGKIQELGLDQFTEEEIAGFTQDAQAMIDSEIEGYVEYYLTEDTEEARSQLRADAQQALESNGYTVENVLESVKAQEGYERLWSKIMADANIQVTDEEIQAEYQQEIARDQEQFEGNVFEYEFYKYYYGVSSLYMPSGYRNILSILLTADEALLNAYQDARNQYEDSIDAGDEAKTAELMAAMNTARQAVLSSQKAVTDDIMTKLAGGESFESLMKTYNNVETAEPTPVHPDSIFVDSDVAAAAFAENMQKPGDVSAPVVTTEGVEIVYYLSDAASGPVPMTDEVREQCKDEVLSTKQEAAYLEALDGWEKEHDIVLNQDVINALAAAGEAAPAEDGEESESGALDEMSEEEWNQLLEQLSQSLGDADGEAADAQAVPETDAQ